MDLPPPLCRLTDFHRSPAPGQGIRAHNAHCAASPRADDDVHLAVNNEVCRGVLSCAMLLPFTLRTGQTLTVHDPVRSTVFYEKG
ncbi:DddA-like double-stranded DNA deaminase toxin [Umezawaea sp. Da 62-37]|uniref:DddA-like double-stranded DNA deaminase toxin n=1 Tax=Umezawaea sp. Da 62-37 TaxID=3075927 RepID=UPI0037DD852D